MRFCQFILAAALVSGGAAAAAVSPACVASRDVRLIHGKIVTMDAHDTIVDTINIKNGRIVGVGQHGDIDPTPCTTTIDLGGRTATPGLIDNHIHMVALGLRPGTPVTLDTAASIAEIAAIVRAGAASAPPGEFVTAIGGWSAPQLAERRLPTLAELDAAAPGRPVLLVTNVGLEGVTNTAGRAFLTAHAVAVDDEGRLASPAAIRRSVFLLKDTMSPAQRRRNTEAAMTWAASVGLTTVMDMGSHEYSGTDSDTIGAFDPSRGYDPLLALARDDRLRIRYRLNLISWDTTPELPLLKARLANSFLGFGSDMLRTSCVGESIWTFDGPGGVGKGVPAPGYAAAAFMVAKRGYCYEQHSLSQVSNAAIIDVWERVNAAAPIAGLRWRIAHAVDIDAATIARLQALGAGIGLHGAHKAPFRTAVASGIHVGAGSDGRNCCAADPWQIIQYIVTGRRGDGVVDNAGETLSRPAALRLYTAANGWFSHEEADLGSIEPGKFADIAVLSRDYLDPGAVPDDAIDRLTSVLTIVGGRVVWRDEGAFPRKGR